MHFHTTVADAQLVKMSLLRIVNTDRKCGARVNVGFRNFYYVPVKVKSFETIEIDIEDVKNENLSSGFGKSIVILTLQKADPIIQYFI